jgi:phosphomannomutase
MLNKFQYLKIIFSPADYLFKYIFEQNCIIYLKLLDLFFLKIKNMPLIKSVSGIRGTIGGKPGENLTPADLLKFTSAYAAFLKKRSGKEKIKVVLGRDARISGLMVSQIVSGTLSACGADVVNIGLATTPTTEAAVCQLSADGGIILTASHNPKNWNALKLLNEKGEFLSAADGKELLSIVENLDNETHYVSVDQLGEISQNDEMLRFHTNKILKHELIDKSAIQTKSFKVVLDGINSVGAFAIPFLLKELGVHDCIVINGEANGEFAHNPEPLAENLSEIRKRVVAENADLGIVVDPDVDRLAFISEDGSMFGEEYTLVAVADYVLKHKKADLVSNLSSSRALRDIAERYGVQYFASAVGEVNVVEEMKKRQALIGGEGNGGVIFPEIHNGRDALTGTALFLSHLAKSGKTCSELRKTYPDYKMLKSKIALDSPASLDAVLAQMKEHFRENPAAEINTVDGVKIDFEKSWVHLRKSNTEPIIRIYAEADTEFKAEELVNTIKQLIGQIK